MANLRISGIAEESIVDSPGIRFVIFTQGCPHHCDGCHNPETHNFSGGYEISHDEIIQKLQQNPVLDGVTFSGGEPFVQATSCAILAGKIKNLGLNIWVYSGYTFEQLLGSENKAFCEFLRYADVLVDGKFDKTKKSLELLFRGSSNQRIIDVPKSIRAGKTILYDVV